MAAEPIQLFVYDLSNGLARTMGRALTGRDIEGIWHTSLVLYGVEVFYGQGISIISPPGNTHHGTPMKRLPMGKTMLDKDTVMEYLEGMREVYAADKYHLLDFNCNSFTNDVLGFLNGQSIPADIINLPRDILATPFGQQMRPMIDQMFRGRDRPAGEAAVSSMLPTLSQTDDVSRSSLTSNLQVVSSVATLSNLLASTTTPLVLMYTSHTCSASQTIRPTFERLAQTHPQIRFAVVDIAGPGGWEIASDSARQFGGPVTATPTFRLWRNGVMAEQVDTPSASELGRQVESLALPASRLSHLALPQLRKLFSNRTPNLHSARPNFAALSSKLSSYLSCASMTSPVPLEAKTSSLLVTQILPLLAAPPSTPLDSTLATSWSDATKNALDVLPRQEWFPVLDLIRLGLATPSIAPGAQPPFMAALSFVMPVPPKDTVEGKPTLLTSLKLVNNAVSSATLGKVLLDAEHKTGTTELVVRALLDSDSGVRRTAAGLAWDCIVVGRGEADEEWDVELASALLEALKSEEDWEVVHRLTASVGVLLLGDAGETIKEVSVAVDARDTFERLQRSAKEDKADVVQLLSEILEILKE